MAKQSWWRRLENAPSWTDRSVEERARALEAACKTATQILEAAPDKQERLNRVDPVPSSTLTLLRRLAARGDA